MKYRGKLAGFIGSICYLLLVASIFSIVEVETDASLNFVSLGMIWGAPFIAGAITVFFATPAQASKPRYFVLAPWFTIAGWSLVSLIFATETLICLVMIAPLFMLAASLGGIFAALARRFLCNRTNNFVISCAAFLPLIVAGIEQPIQEPTLRATVIDSIVVNAPLDQVWKSLPNILDIKSEELPWTLSHALGIPKPVSATTQNLELGGIRHIVWERGVKFQERITNIVVNERISYDVLADEESMALANLDTHVVVGDKFFDVESGSYTLASTDEGTKISLTTSYRVTTNLNWYGKLWANFVLDDFHNSVLHVIKNRNEG